MQYFSRFVSFLVVAALSAVFSVSPASSTTPFQDMNAAHPYVGAVAYLKSSGAIHGYADGTFRPEQTISRAEIITILVAAVEKNPVGKNCFSDVHDEWFAKYVCWAKKKGVVSGYGDGTFRPNQNVSLAESSVIVARNLHVTLPKVAQGQAWFAPSVNFMASKAAIPVSIDFTEKKVTRSEVAEMIARLQKKDTTESTKTLASLTASFPTLGSCEELKDKISYFSNANRPVMYYKSFGLGVPGAMPPTAIHLDMAMPEMATAGAGASNARSFSTTNVQVEGVDEADVVKNDADYIYLLKGNTVRLVKAYPASAMAETAKISFEDAGFHPREMYISADNKLVVVGDAYAEKSQTVLYVYDVSDHAKPVQERKIAFDGSYVSSRRVADHVYVVTNDSPRIYYFDGIKPLPALEKLVPQFLDSKTGTEQPMAACDQIRFNPRYAEPNYLSVASFSLKDGENKVSREVFMGMGGTVYSSLENMYVAAEKNEYNEGVRYNIWQPPVVNQTTVLYRFQLNNGDVQYKGQGSVPGHLLNQFSMDEFDGNFRVATTQEGTFVGSTQTPPTNSLFVLDVNNLQHTLGKINDIAPGERFYSVRFMGKRAYLVTFKSIDPFFVADLSNPSSPKILGELKIPGYSNYLHPYDENHIIGFGKEVDPTIDAEKVHTENAVYYTAIQGMKIALFDVTDVANPKEMFKEVIGDRGTDSPLLTDHKALLFDKVRGLFAFPISVSKIDDAQKANREFVDGHTVFQGAYVYTLDLQNGFQLKGTITHLSENAFSNGYLSVEFDNVIQRIVSIGENLYTVSQGVVKATAADTMQASGSVTLEKDPEPDYGRVLMPLK